jgi:hypothetical protein
VNNNHKLQQVAEDYQPGDHLKEGTWIFIFLSVQPKVWEKVRLHTSPEQRQLSPGRVDAVWYKHFSAAGGIEQPVLLTAHRQTSQS